MGLDPLMITRVGEDERGNRLLSAMGERNLRTEGVLFTPLALLERSLSLSTKKGIPSLIFGLVRLGMV